MAAFKLPIRFIFSDNKKFICPAHQAHQIHNSILYMCSAFIIMYWFLAISIVGNEIFTPFSSSAGVRYAIDLLLHEYQYDYHKFHAEYKQMRKNI